MWKLFIDKDNVRWAYKDNSQIYCQTVWLLDKKDWMKYHLIDENREEIPCNPQDYLVEDHIWNEHPYPRDKDGNPLT
jgi:hypothetical protein